MAAKLKSFEDLDVWKKAHWLALRVYKAAKKYPQDEKSGLVSQIKSSAAAIPANIAKGFQKSAAKDKLNFYGMAQESLNELKYYMILSKDLKYISDNSETIWNINEAGKMLVSLMAKIPKR